MTEIQFLYPVISDAIEMAGIDRRDIGFTCAGSCDYLSGQTFAFVMNLEAVGAWPPISESHVEMDGAWAMYEAWIRCSRATSTSRSRSARGRARPACPGEIYPLQMDPYTLTPLGADPVSLAGAAGPGADRLGQDHRARDGRDRRPQPAQRGEQPVRAGEGQPDVDELLKEPYFTAPLRKHDLPPISDGASAVILATADKARELCERPVWIRGIDHRIDIHQPGFRDLTRLDVDGARRARAPVSVTRRSSSPSCA